ncbi:MAG: DEAD/DEAH box helicase [Bdellovibrionota bacterium]
MLFYSQIKKEFSQVTWRRGQLYFHEERVQNVRLERDIVLAQVQGTSEQAYETALVMSRGTISNSKCSCPAHRVYETHCKHIAALSIWIVERGSLLRAGVGASKLGVAENDRNLVLKSSEKVTTDVRLKKLLQSHPVLLTSQFLLRRDLLAGFVECKNGTSVIKIPVTFIEAAALKEHGQEAEHESATVSYIEAEAVAYVRGFFQNKAMVAVSIEPAMRYTDPENSVTQVQTLNYLTREREPGTWRTAQGALIKLKNEAVPVLGSINSAKIIHQGQAALQNLAALLTSRDRDQLVFHQAVDLEVDNNPLKLMSFKIGKKTDKTRSIHYEFKSNSGGSALTSHEIERLANEGRVSDEYVWKGDKIYKLGTSLSRLAQYANRSGIATAEGEDGESSVALAVGKLYDHGDHPLHPITAYRLSLELGVENFDVDADWLEFHEWRKTFEKKRIAALPKIEYGFQLRDYQNNGLSWMWSLYHRGLSALLADDMGLGKTHQVLAFLSSIYYSKRTRPKEPSLVVAPTSVVTAWVQKLTKYDTGLIWHVFHGKSRKPQKSDTQVVLTTYGILQREPNLRDMQWHTVMLDEAQAIKNPGTLSARCARSLKAKYKIAMTGTPVENQAVDLWSINEFLLPGYLGSLARFKRLYGFSRELESKQQADTLRRMVSPFLLRRTKAQVLKELPEKTEEVMHCEMTPVQDKAYHAYLISDEAKRVRENLKNGEKVDYASILALLTRLKQVCDHPKLPELSSCKSGYAKKLKSIDPKNSGKWETFEEILNEALGSQLKIVVFTQYLGVIDIISKFLKEQGIDHEQLRGDTTDRSKRIDRFSNDPGCKLFLCSLLAGGLGIDLTAASVCIHIDRWWNPAKENQATDRLHRIGQTRGVQIFKLQIPGTVEDRIANIIASKVALSGALVEESSVGLKTFSRKELLEILSP